MCCITGSRCYSADLVQGGLEILCTLTFEGSSTLVLKPKALLQALSNKNMKEEKFRKEGKHTEVTPPDPPASPPSKKKKISEDSRKWLQYGGIVLSQKDKRNILKGDKLNDLVIDFAQQLLKSQNLGIIIWDAMHSITIKEAGTSQKSTSNFSRSGRSLDCRIYPSRNGWLIYL